MSTHSKEKNTEHEQALEAVNKKLETCQQELMQVQDRYTHLSADFQNYKKRVERDKALWTTSARNEVLRDMLSLIDDVERALQESKLIAKPSSDLHEWIKGLRLIHEAQLKVLHTHGVVPIADDEAFDPHTHEAIAQVPSDDHESGTIVQIVERGYRSGDTILRPAKVTVAQ